ncbi:MULTISPECIES: fic family toxin-antitoxin system, toxin component [unclassified Streptomyces]|uniref:fic family toxin-antitoxin system, toxin component n=1 Tax=unclassified Streptomyces TaxID=2593676 RepID=UPI002DD983F4|nr:fic family toxin-antitoxin system, toxin component [Streptomyces sp. NBC_00151]WRZ44196.1 fic family toxin-antitoxin system, toxin component [Streptomyces sp. NBC_00151]
MDLHIDVPWILQVAEAAGADDPAPDDYGVPASAVARHRAELFEQPVYGGPYAKAAALVHTLGRCRWLERSNLAVAAASGVMYLEAAGIGVKPVREDAVALRDLLLDPTCTAARIAALLRTWPTTT